MQKARYLSRRNPRNWLGLRQRSRGSHTGYPKWREIPLVLPMTSHVSKLHLQTEAVLEAEGSRVTGGTEAGIRGSKAEAGVGEAVQLCCSAPSTNANVSYTLVPTSALTVALKSPGGGTIATPEVGEVVVTIEVTEDTAMVPGVVVCTLLITGAGGPVQTPGGGEEAVAKTPVVPPQIRAPVAQTTMATSDQLLPQSVGTMGGHFNSLGQVGFTGRS